MSLNFMVLKVYFKLSNIQEDIMFRKVSLHSSVNY